MKKITYEEYLKLPLEERERVAKLSELPNEDERIEMENPIQYMNDEETIEYFHKLGSLTWEESIKRINDRLDKIYNDYMSSYRRTGTPCIKGKNMKHWHGNLLEYKKTLPTTFVDTYIGISKYILTNIGSMPQYYIYAFGEGTSISFIAVGDDKIGYAIIENTGDIDKESVMAFVQANLGAIEDVLEHRQEEDGSVSIDPDMNLGIEVPGRKKNYKSR